jgi:hypothetical protein
MRPALILALMAIGAGCHLVAGIEDGTAACPVDGARNGLEVDVDCGGPCAACPDGAHCQRHEDCSSNSCDSTGRCRVATCEDFRTNGTETDEDCGGPDDECGRCYGGDSCLVDADCTAPQNDGKPTCVQGRCVSSCCHDDCGDGCCPQGDPDCCDDCPQGGLGSPCNSDDPMPCNPPLSCLYYEEPSEQCY